MVKLLLVAGACTEVYDEDNCTPLLITVYTDRIDIMKTLIDFGADVNKQNSHKYTALHHAAWNGRREMVQFLLECSAQDNDPTDDGNTPLALAAHGGHYCILEMLINRGCCVNNSDKDKDTPLLYAVHNGDSDSCKLLIDNGADCCVCNRAGVTITWEAAYTGHASLLRYLIVHGNPPLSAPSRGLVYEYAGAHPPFIYDEEHTPLFVAIKRKRFDVAELLLDAGVMMCEERWCWNSNWSDEIDYDDSRQVSLCSRLSRAMSEAPSLLHLARHGLRRHIGQRILTVVPLLEIPQTLRDYLAFRSLEMHINA